MEISEQQKVPKIFFLFSSKARQNFVLLSFSFVCLIFLLFFILFSVLWFISHIFLITTLSIFSLSFFSFFACCYFLPLFLFSVAAFRHLKKKKRASTFLLPLLLPIFYFLLNIVPFLSFTHKNASKHNMM